MPDSRPVDGSSVMPFGGRRKVKYEAAPAGMDIEWLRTDGMDNPPPKMPTIGEYSVFERVP